MGPWLLLEIMEKNSNKGVTKPCIAAGWAINNKRGRKKYFLIVLKIMDFNP